MVGRTSAREEGVGKERRALSRCRRALERGRRVRGRRVATGEEGLLVDLRGILGHVPRTDGATDPAPRSIWGRSAEHWEGWVVAVGRDLVHLSARRPEGGGEQEAARSGEITGTGRSGARARLEDGSVAVVPWEELSWEPWLERPELPPGTPIAGRVVGLTLDGPVLSPRAVLPTPWPAIALAHPAGTAVCARVEAHGGGRARVRLERAPRAVAIVDAPELRAGDLIEAVVEEVNPIAGRLALRQVSPAGPRAVRPAPAAPTPEPPGPEQAASGSRS